MFSDSNQTFNGNSQEESSDVVEFGIGVNFLGQVSFQVRRFEVVSSGKIGNQRSFSSLDQNCACTGGGGFV